LRVDVGALGLADPVGAVLDAAVDFHGGHTSPGGLR
jgi:hypothetical protein